MLNASGLRINRASIICEKSDRAIEPPFGWETSLWQQKGFQNSRIIFVAVYSANLPLHRLLKPLLDEVGLTYPQYLVLIALYDDDHQTVGGLGDKLFLDSSTLEVSCYFCYFSKKVASCLVSGDRCACLTAMDLNLASDAAVASLA